MKNKTQEVKKDKGFPYDSYLEPRSKNRGRLLVGSMHVDADNQLPVIKMKQKKTITQIMGNKETLVGLILGAGVGYIGAELVYLVHYLFYKEIEIVSFSINSLWGIFLVCVWFWMLKKIQQRSIK